MYVLSRATLRGTLKLTVKSLSDQLINKLTITYIHTKKKESKPIENQFTDIQPQRF